MPHGHNITVLDVQHVTLYKSLSFIVSGPWAMVMPWNWNLDPGLILDDAGGLFFVHIQIKHATMSQDRGLAQAAV